MYMPADNAILLSAVNMKLRDGCESLEELCTENDWDREEVCSRLASMGYYYDEARNTFACKG